LEHEVAREGGALSKKNEDVQKKKMPRNCEAVQEKHHNASFNEKKKKARSVKRTEDCSQR